YWSKALDVVGIDLIEFRETVIGIVTSGQCPLLWVFRKLDQFIIGEGRAISKKRGGANTGHKQELAHSFPPETLVRSAWNARSRGAGALSLQLFPAACWTPVRQKRFHNKAVLTTRQRLEKPMPRLQI